jgi:hypothetical protein
MRKGPSHSPDGGRRPHTDLRPAPSRTILAEYVAITKDSKPHRSCARPAPSTLSLTFRNRINRRPVLGGFISGIRAGRVEAEAASVAEFWNPAELTSLLRTVSGRRGPRRIVSAESSLELSHNGDRLVVPEIHFGGKACGSDKPSDNDLRRRQTERDVLGYSYSRHLR